MEKGLGRKHLAQALRQKKVYSEQSRDGKAFSNQEKSGFDKEAKK